MKISVIIPAYNSEDTIAECLDSVFAQTFDDFEVIVVNDGSTEGTLEKLKPYLDRINLINQKNNGSNAARNRGWREARGEFLIFADSDVIMKPDMFEKLLRALEANPQASYAYSSFKYGGKLFKLWPFDGKRLQRMPFIATTSLVRARDFPGFDESIKRFQDWDVWLTMYERGKTGIWVPETLWSASVRQNGISSWVPRWFFWIPWRVLGWIPERVKKYQEAVQIIKRKHKL